jgi:alkylglycerol monooxygenase
MDISVVIIAIPFYFLLIGIELVFERIEKRKLYRLNDAVTNISCGITDQVTGVFAGVVGILLYEGMFALGRSWGLPEINGSWYAWVAAFLLVDLAYYWAHRMSHEVNLMWAGHVVHHQSEEYNLSVALRQSATQKFYSMFFYAPLAFMGFPTEWFLLCMGINLLYQFWIHTELVGKLPRPIEWVMNTPSHHRVHHGRDPKYIDRNHAGVFIIWDRLFGTFKEEEETPTYGITNPVQSWNPLYVQVAHYVNIAQDLKKVKGFNNKMGVLFRKPGWLPKEAGGPRYAEEVDKRVYQKYDVRLPQAMNYYLLGQYVLTLGVTAWFLFTVAARPLPINLLVASWLLLSIASLGSLFGARKWAIALEVGRMLAGAVLAFWLMSGLGAVMLILAGALVGLSLFWFWRVSPGIQQGIVKKADLPISSSSN